MHNETEFNHLFVAVGFFLTQSNLSQCSYQHLMTNARRISSLNGLDNSIGQSIGQIWLPEHFFQPTNISTWLSAGDRWWKVKPCYLQHMKSSFYRVPCVNLPTPRHEDPEAAYSPRWMRTSPESRLPRHLAHMYWKNWINSCRKWGAEWACHYNVPKLQLL